MGAGATDSELDLLRAATGALPEEVAAWYRWHAGSGSGLVPGTEWGLLTIKEALAEIEFAKSSSGPPELSDASSNDSLASSLLLRSMEV